MTALLDANVLIALVVTDHVHHDVAEHWYERSEGALATCPITQGALVRFLLCAGATTSDALDPVRGLRASGRHEFWPDDLPLDDVDFRGVVGHRQVTDAYLSGLARARGARLVTLDSGLAALHPDVADLLDGGPAAT